MTKWDYAATAAVSLAHLLVMMQGDAAGLVLFDDQVRQHVPASANIASLAGLVDVIEHHAPAGRTDVSIPMIELAERVPRRGLVVVISDLLTDIEASGLLEGLHRLRAAQHGVIVLHVLHGDELEFPFTDRTLFEGMEQTDQRVLTDPQSLRETYRRGVRRFIDRLRTACLDRRIHYSLFNTGDPLDRVLSSFLAERMHAVRSRR